MLRSSAALFATPPSRASAMVEIAHVRETVFDVVAALAAAPLQRVEPIARPIRHDDRPAGRMTLLPVG